MKASDIVKLAIGYPILVGYAACLIVAMPFVLLWMWLNGEISFSEGGPDE